MAIDLKDLSPKELQALITSANAQMQEAHANQIRTVRTKIDAVLKSAGLSIGDVYPTRGGGVQIEWEDDLQEVELEIYPDGKMSFLFEEKGSGRMTERVVESGTGAVQPGFLSQLRHVIAA